MSNRTWRAKFGNAFAGLYWGVSGQRSFVVHFLVAAAVVAAGAILRVTIAEWSALVLCITLVLSAEMFNSALETLAKAVTQEHDERVGRALDMAAAAVLLAAIGSGAVGLAIFLPHLWRG